MLCPKCNIDTRTDMRDGRTVLVCRNPQCPFFDKTVSEVKEVEKHGEKG